MTNLRGVGEEMLEPVAEEREIFSEEDKVAQAVGEIRETGNYEVFLNKGKGIATATVRDLLAVSNPGETKLGTVAYHVPVLSSGDRVGRAAKLMFEYRLRAIPLQTEGTELRVVSAKGVVGLLSSQGTLGIRASDVMTPRPVTIGAEESVAKARELMMRRSFDHLPVIYSGKVGGILTSHQLLFNLLPAESVPSGAVGVTKSVRFHYATSRLAETPLIHSPPEADLSVVAQSILKSRYTYSLVTVWDELQGIITLRDIVKVVEAKKEKTLPFYIVGLPKDPFQAEAAKMKFERLASTLTKAYPVIEEVRAIVKTKEINPERRRYEVNVNVYSPRSSYAYSESGYDLPELFDAISPKLKRLLGSKQSRVTKAAGRTIRRGEPAE